MKVRKSFTIDKELLRELSEFRWRSRIESLSEALERVLRLGLDSLKSMQEIEEDEKVLEQRRVNNEAYARIEGELDRYKGKYVIIALGRLIGAADSFGEAVEILRRKAPEAKHAIVKRVGREEEVEREWPGLLERLK
ncbi:hypothetical protein J7L00_01820 [Candidatus Bathyarchaeota archaeon]|nr:hypothetical protein [Candidatus Bathyarchaeota archaeon]